MQKYYNTNTIHQAKKKNREVEQCASEKNNHIIDAILFIKQQQK